MKRETRETETRRRKRRITLIDSRQGVICYFIRRYRFEQSAIAFMVIQDRKRYGKPEIEKS